MPRPIAKARINRKKSSRKTGKLHEREARAFRRFFRFYKRPISQGKPFVHRVQNFRYEHPGNDFQGADDKYTTTSFQPHLVLSDSSGKARHVLKLDKKNPLNLAGIQRLRTQTSPYPNPPYNEGLFGWDPRKERLEAKKFSNEELGGVAPENFLVMSYLSLYKKEILQAIAQGKPVTLTLKVGMSDSILQYKLKGIYAHVIDSFFEEKPVKDGFFNEKRKGTFGGAHTTQAYVLRYKLDLNKTRVRKILGLN